MKRILVIAALLIASSSLALGQTLARKMTAPGKTAKTSSVEQAITQMENQRRESFLKGDAAYFERVLAEDYSGTGRNGEVTNKAQSVANVKSGSPSFESFSYDDVNVRVYGNTAVVTGRATVKGRDRGQDISGQTHYTRVYVKQPGGWQLVSHQITPVAQP